MKKTVLVTGGAGYIGSAISWTLNKAGYKVVVVDRQKTTQPWAEAFCADIQDTQAVAEIFGQIKIDAVIHCAALTSVADSVLKPLEYYQNNFSATLGLLEVMAKFGVRDFVFASSAAVYGGGGKNPLSEQDPCRPISPYGKSKLFVERCLADYAYISGLRSVVLRYFNVAGAIFDGQTKIGESHEPETHLIPRVVDKVKNSQPIEVFGFELDTPDGSPLRDFVHVADVARANLLALQFLERTKKSDVFNISTGRGVSVLEVLAKAEELTGNFPIIKQALPRTGDPEVLLGCPEKAQKLLGWTPKASSFDQIFRDAFAWSEAAKKAQMLQGL